MVPLIKGAPMDYAKFEELYGNECKRKEKILDLIATVEVPLKNKKALKKKFSRIIRDGFLIERIEKATLVLSRGNGEEINPVRISHELADLFRVSDHLFATIGLKDSEWFFVRVECIGSPTESFLPPEPESLH
jgi:hypothetical protein